MDQPAEDRLATVHAAELNTHSGDRSKAKTTRMGDSDLFWFSDCEYIEGMTFTHFQTMKLKTLFSPVAALTIAFGGGIAAPVRAGSDAYNVGYAGGLLHGFTCKSRNGEITQSEARSEMRRLLKAEGVPVSYASRSDVMETAKTLFLIKGC